MGFFHWLAKKLFSEEFKAYEDRFAKHEAEIRAQPLFEREAQQISENVQMHFNHYMNCREAVWDERSQIIFKKMDEAANFLDIPKITVAGEKILSYEERIERLVSDLEERSKDLQVVVKGLQLLNSVNEDLQKIKDVLRKIKPLDIDENF